MVEKCRRRKNLCLAILKRYADERALEGAVRKRISQMPGGMNTSATYKRRMRDPKMVI